MGKKYLRNILKQNKSKWNSHLREKLPVLGDRGQKSREGAASREKSLRKLLAEHLLKQRRTEERKEGIKSHRGGK